MDEYEQVQRLRELWSRSIDTWGRLFIFLGAGIVSLFVKLSYDARIDTSQMLFIAFIGWLLFLICMIYWRWLVHHIDDQIVQLYPSMLRLERERRWETQTRYYYHNLSTRALEYLTRRLRLRNALGVNDYERFRESVRNRRLNQQGLLLDAWREFNRGSVNDRGHYLQDFSVFIIVLLLSVPIAYLAGSFYFNYSPFQMAMLLIIFYLLVAGVWYWRRLRLLTTGVVRRDELALRDDLLLRRYIISLVPIWFTTGFILLLGGALPPASITTMYLYGIPALAFFAWALIMGITAWLPNRLAVLRELPSTRWGEMLISPLSFYAFLVSFVLSARDIVGKTYPYSIGFLIVGIVIILLLAAEPYRAAWLENRIRR